MRLNLAPHLDAGESAFFERELAHIRPQTYDVKYPDVKFRQLLPIDYSVDAGADSIVYQQFDEVAQARIIASYADDLPVAEVKGKEFSSLIKGIGIAFHYSMQEIRAAAKAGRALTPKKAIAARGAIERLLERIAAIGDTATGLKGLLNQPSALTYTVPSGVGGVTWALKTPDEILADLNGIVQYIVDQTNEVESPDTIVMPPGQLGLIRTLRLNDLSETTVLEYFLSKNGRVKNVESWSRCDAAGANATDRMCAYSRNPEKLQMVIPLEFTQHPPQPVGLKFEVPTEARTGGVTCEYQMSIAYGDGI